MPALYLPILYGTVREERKSFGVARFVLQRLERRPDVETELFDPRDLPFGNLVKRFKDMKDPTPQVQDFASKMRRADGYVIVTPEYNYGIPGALKNLLDTLYAEWNRKPFGIVAAGGLSGGLRAADQLRQVIAGLGAVTVPAHVPVPHVGKTFGTEGPIEEGERWEQRVDKFLDEVEWYARALQQARNVENKKSKEV